MIRAPKRISERQLRALYWPSWNKARKVLLANHHSKEEAEEIRQTILAKQGVESSKLLNNRQLDDCLKAFASISDPRDGKRQAELADQSLKRVRHRIAQTAAAIGYTAENLEGIAQQMFRRPMAQLNEPQLVKVSQALQTHANRHQP
jgi:hypothetical protein